MKPIRFLQPVLALCLLAAGALSAQAATLTVLNNTDTGTDSLRGRIAAAADGDTIIFDASLNGATITLGGTTLTIDKNLIIDASALTGGITIDGNGASQVFFIWNFEVELRKLVITGGGNEGLGAGIGSYGDLTLTDCTISGNNSTSRGGGIYSQGKLTVSRCTVSDNTSVGPGGGIVIADDPFFGTTDPVASFTNSTITDNQSDVASAFYLEGPLTLTLDHCTVSQNHVLNNTFGIESAIYTANGQGQVTVRNSIVAANTPSTHPDIYYGGSGINWTIEGVNIIGNNLTAATQFPATAGLIGTSASPVDPLLGTLANNGGPTQTVAPQAASPAINAATGTLPATDQRGFPRNGAADIGAFEVQSSNANLTNLVLSDVNLDPTFNSATVTYDATAGAAVSSLTVTPTKEDAGATITVNGSPVSSGAASGGITLNVGAGNIITVVVTAQDLVTTKTYTVDVTRLSDNANLSSLVLNDGTLSPTFASGTLPYTATTGSITASLLVTPTAENAGATITVNGSPVLSGAASPGIPLNFGAGNIVTVIVTAQDQVATKTYTINVTRLPATTDGNGNGFSDLEEFYLADVPTAFRVGDQNVTIDLSTALPARPTGQALAMTGLPRGLTFNPGTRLITGTILGELGDAAVTIQIKAGRTVVGSIPFGLSVAPYPYLGGWQALIVDGGGSPIGQVKLTVTGPRAASASLQRMGTPKRAASGAAIVFETEAIPVQTVVVTFPAGPNGVPSASVVEMDLSSASDLFAGSHDTTNTLRGFRLAKPGRTSTQRVTVAFENEFGPGDRSLEPQGTGYAFGRLSSLGLLSVNGLLGDAQKLTLSLYPTQTNHAVVWAQPYVDKAGSYFGGIVAIGHLGYPERGGPSPTDLAQVTADGVGIQWKKADGTVEIKSYPSGFGPLAVTGKTSKWVPVPSVEALSRSLGLSFREVFVDFAPTDLGLNPAQSLPKKLSLRGLFSLVRLLPTASRPWSGAVVPSNGTFSGTLRLTGATTTTVHGVLLQDSSFDTQIGTGVVKIPTVTPVIGSYQTGGIHLQSQD